MTQLIDTSYRSDTFSAATDEQLLVRYRDNGDVNAFETLVHRYEKPLHRYLLRFLHSAALADEVTQASFLRLHQKRKLFDDQRRVKPWLYNIATHLAIDALRAEGRQHAASLDAMQSVGDDDVGTLLNLLQSTSPSPIEELEIGERAKWIREAVNKLPSNLRVVVLLVYFQGLTFHEAAETLHWPLGTVKSRVHQALLALHGTWRQGPTHGSE